MKPPMAGENVVQEILVQLDAFYLQETGSHRLQSAKSCVQCVAQSLHFASAYHAFQFLNAEAADVVVHVVEALAAYALQDKMAVQPHLLAKTVAAERAVLPLLLVCLHPEVDAFKAMQVRLVEVILVRFLALLRLSLRHLLDDRARQFQSQRLEGAERQVKIQHREENHLGSQQPDVEVYGNIRVEHHRQTHEETVA